MEIEFRQGCEECNGPPKILACDGTNIDIGFKNMFIKPIETHSNLSMMQTPHNRLDQCFITNSDGNNTCFTAARKQLQSLYEKIISCPYNESVISGKYSKLEPECLPSKKRPAFKRIMSNNISSDI